MNDVSLKPYNTFGLDVKAAQFVHLDSVNSLVDLIRKGGLRDNDFFLLGGGSNVLLRSDLNGLVIRNEIPGIEIIREDQETVVIQCGSGENWHGLVQWTLDHGYFGLENLSLIPGTVGAAPMQNIGAYGVELREVFKELEAVDLQTGDIHVFNSEECQFGYRQSIFKSELKGKYFIASVTLELHRRGQVNIEYGAIQETLRAHGITQPTPIDVSRAVIAIRRSKLPDPAEIGNAGSFFKNPVIDPDQFRRIKEEWTGLPGYGDGELVKVPAGWLIEKCGWKGKRSGDAGVHEKQALVLVNYGKASGEEIFQLSEQIQQSVWDTFGIKLQREVNIL